MKSKTQNPKMVDIHEESQITELASKINKDEQVTFGLAISRCKDGFITKDQVLEGVREHIEKYYTADELLERVIPRIEQMYKKKKI